MRETQCQAVSNTKLLNKTTQRSENPLQNKTVSNLSQSNTNKTTSRANNDTKIENRKYNERIYIRCVLIYSKDFRIKASKSLTLACKEEI